MTVTIAEEQRRRFIDEGFLVVRGLLPTELVSSTRDSLLAALEIETDSPASWSGKAVSSDPAALALTVPCRTDGVEDFAEQLVGPTFVRGLCHSPYLEAKGICPAMISGYIPVLNFPTPGPRTFQKPAGYHIDGMHLTTLWPGMFSLVVFAYLTDVARYGGATTVLPGSHRQVFEHWRAAGHPGSTTPPDLEYAEPLPLEGRAGDVIFMHYLTVHSGSPNHSDHIRVGLNTATMPDPKRPYVPKPGAPQPDWTPLDYTLRTDTLV